MMCLTPFSALEHTLSESHVERKCGMGWIDLAQDRDKWGALVNTVIDILVP
jgi:hypothetical protein